MVIFEPSTHGYHAQIKLVTINLKLTACEDICLPHEAARRVHSQH